MKKLITCCLLTLACFAEPTIVNLEPPKFQRETIGSETSCTRPMRDGTFNISIQSNEERTLVHCYGHGGSGWTTLFGSVNRAIALFQDYYANPEECPPIRIVGAGCMGLTTAIELKRMGYPVAGITAKSIYDLTSWTAAGYFALVSLKTSPEEEAVVHQIGIDTFKTYQQVASGEHAYFSKECATYMPVYCSSATDAGLGSLEDAALIPMREEVTLDFGNGTVHENYNRYMTYFMNTTRLMQELHLEAARLEIPIEVCEIENFDQVEEEIVFNCSGLGGKTLNNDELMIAVRGHLFMMNEDAGDQHMDYMIYTQVEQDGNQGYVYMFPKNGEVTSGQPDGSPCFSCIGGTFIPNTDQLSAEELEELDRKEFDKMYERVDAFFNQK